MRSGRLRLALLIGLGVVLAALTAGGAWLFLLPAGQGNSEGYVYIAPETPSQELQTQVRYAVGLKYPALFRVASGVVGLDKHRQSGAFLLTGRMSMARILHRLMRGHPSDVQVVFRGGRTPADCADQITRPLKTSSQELSALLADSLYCARFGLTPRTILTLFLPDTYRFYWDTSAHSIVERFYKYHQRFWGEERRTLARAAGLTPVEVSVLASIVEEESAKPAEYPVIAGLYLNRLRKGMKLQADPTVKYAVGDFTLRRITAEHTRVQSPYNTYQVTGLPPGPIRTPQQATIDSVLHYTQHNYIYMCAREDFSGYHRFTASYAEHMQNARRYQAALNARNIR